MKITVSRRGLVAAVGFVCLAAGLALAEAWSRAPAEPEHAAEVRTGIICGTPQGDCVIPAQLVGEPCTCPAGTTPAGQGVVLPTVAARGG